MLTSYQDWQEWQANCFAGELLVPAWDVKKEFQKLAGCQVVVVPAPQNPSEIADEIAVSQVAPNPARGGQCALHELYAVSRQAMAIRLLGLKLVRSDCEVERRPPMT
jgi:Zn-dependent peptidase ImmA (M78 family)